MILWHPIGLISLSSAGEMTNIPLQSTIYQSSKPKARERSHKGKGLSDLPLVLLQMLAVQTSHSSHRYMQRPYLRENQYLKYLIFQALGPYLCYASSNFHYLHLQLAMRIFHDGPQFGIPIEIFCYTEMVAFPLENTALFCFGPMLALTKKFYNSHNKTSVC